MNKSNDLCVMCGKPIVEGEGMVCRECITTGGPTVPIKNLHIKDSYNIWSTTMMYAYITVQCYEVYGVICADKVLNRSWKSLYIEWYLHNIGYWITLPFIKNNNIKSINERCKHVDLEEYTRKNISTKK
jgi:hypothetical protein